jgi:hypothetical protein
MSGIVICQDPYITLTWPPTIDAISALTAVAIFLFIMIAGWPRKRKPDPKAEDPLKPKYF